ncbi:cell division protein FtsA [Hypnocyclicus thermotrophus]|uniref:Cell division protein FtsA n=1 Tax=Hypnocyclicus thermotrophus TaxID=1627895 RepID=A0AA46DYR2_9FUSO|nr:cell division FtsA domain-containing protein [Hypnocyclicus thermotrophus]TDT70606.1 cell division protein FtsA [Hypnocyclicus thermotrophus]
MKKVYALDVGTRNVVLLLAEYTEEDKIKIIDMVSKEHESRAMLDGQIHDISKVAKTVKILKDTMEDKTKEKIEEVAVAVAGRNLITFRGKAKKSFDSSEELSEDDILTVELLAIQNTIKSLGNENNKEYYCVGYSVIEYKLDGVEIKNPLYQKGEELEIELLATFLPKVVVDSMYTMLNKVDLGIENLTLEPIAAINVVVPEDMRKLNIALVDIGAGTSDIAITKSGKVVGYGMVPMAGDEITEKIEEDYLLDFEEAERIKKSLKDNEIVKYQDILGIEYEITTKEIFEKIDPILEKLSLKISEKILELNEGAPQAIILIGGGSLIPKLREKIAEKVSLVAGRVAVRGTEAIKSLVNSENMLSTAEYVTPIGIANMAFQGKEFNILTISINKVSHRVFSFTKHMSLMEVLLSIGYDTKLLYSKPGNAITVTINGKLEIFKGEMGKRAVIKVNNKFASLDKEIKDGDTIEIKPIRDGRDAVVSIKDLKKKYDKIKFKLNDKTKEIDIKILKDGKSLDDKYLIQDRDELEILNKIMVKDVISESLEKTIKIILNGKELEMIIPGLKIYKDEEEITPNYIIQNGDNIRIEKNELGNMKIKDILEETDNKFKVIVNEKEIIFDELKKSIILNGKVVSSDREIKDGDKIDFDIPEENLPLVSDVFKYYDPKTLLNDHESGKLLKIIVNSKEAEFTTKIKNGDVINFYYK